MTLSVARDYVEQGHPLQLHLPGAGPHAVRRWLPREELSGAEAEMFEKLSRLPADRPHGQPGGDRRARALPLLRRVRVHHRPPTTSTAGSPCCADRDSFCIVSMKLTRFGSRGRVRPACFLSDDRVARLCRASASDYDEAFFGSDGLARLAGWVDAHGPGLRAGRCGRASGSARRSRVRARSSASASTTPTTPPNPA